MSDAARAAGASPTAEPAVGEAVGSALRHAALDPDGTRRRELVWQDPLRSLPEAAGLDGLALMEAVAAGELPPPPIAVLMRMGPVELEQGRVVFEGVPGEEHYNPIGTVHGGYAATLLDSALGCAVHTTLPAGSGYSTQTLEVKMVRPITRDTGAVRAEATVDYRGRRQATASARVTAVETGKLLAQGTSTLMIFSASDRS